jgi:CheY-like chemotaxis protein
VEDSPAVAEVVRSVLHDLAGWNAIAVDEAGAALDALRRTRVDLLVLDVNLPGTSGTELLLRLRRAGCAIPAIVMSANPCPPEIAHLLRTGGAAAFLAKPFDVDDLLTAAHEAAPDSSGRRTPEDKPGRARYADQESHRRAA